MYYLCPRLHLCTLKSIKSLCVFFFRLVYINVKSIMVFSLNCYNSFTKWNVLVTLADFKEDATCIMVKKDGLLKSQRAQNDAELRWPTSFSRYNNWGEPKRAPLLRVGRLPAYASGVEIYIYIYIYMFVLRI